MNIKIDFILAEEACPDEMHCLPKYVFQAYIGLNMHRQVSNGVRCCNVGCPGPSLLVQMLTCNV